MIKSKNKMSRRIMLSTLTFSSLLGVGLSLNFINSINSKEEINTVNLIEENLVNYDEGNNIVEQNIPETRAIPTSIVQVSSVNFSNYYPFEVIPNIQLNTPILPSDPFWNFFQIAGSVQPNVADVTFKVKSISLNNRGANAQSGRLALTGTMSAWTDGNLTSNDPADYSITINNMRSVTDRTVVTTNTAVRPLDTEYASDYLPASAGAVKFISMSNNISSRVDTNFNTELEAGSVITFDNATGSLTVPGVIRNYIDVNGNYITGSTTQRVTINGFKKIDGPTGYLASENASLTRPSIIFESADSNGSLSEALQTQYFGTLQNPLTTKNAQGNFVPNTKLVDFVVSEPNNENGTIRVTLTVTGGYYGYDAQNRLVPIKAASDTERQTFSFVVSGIGRFVEEVDNTLNIVIAAIGGGVGFIAILIGLIFFIKFQKKKNEEVRKRKSMEDKLYTMSNKPKEASGPGGIAPGAGGMAPGMGRPGSAPGKYVPPTISVPKSNAPVVKRPSGPTPPPPPTKK